jgi:hypothetical protein
MRNPGIWNNKVKSIGHVKLNAIAINLDWYKNNIVKTSAHSV